MLSLLGCSKPETANPPHAMTSGILSLSMFLRRVEERTRVVAGDRKLRLAVIPLRSTESQHFADKGFGTFITEKISSTLGAPGSPVRLFERARLDAVLQEQKLSSSGLFNESEARRLGELAPIDILLTGTFTRLDESLSVNLRFIDVVSGEVRGSLSENLELGPDLAGLFEDLRLRVVVLTSGSNAVSKSDDHPCDSSWNRVRALKEDIRTPEKLDQLVEAAMAIPFEGACGEIHDEVIQHLVRYKQYSERYGAFLVKTLQSMETEDERAWAIPRYLLAKGQLEDPAWKALLRIAATSKRFSNYLEPLLADPKPSARSRQRIQDRIGIILAQVDARQVGRPVPLEPGPAFTAVMSALRHNFLGPYNGDVKDLGPLLDAYRNYGPRYAAEGDPRLMAILVAMYEASTPGGDRDRILDALGDRVNHFAPGRELADQLAPFLHTLYERREDARKKHPEAAADLKHVMGVCGPHVAQSLSFIPGTATRLEVTGLCLENQIQGESVPTLEALEQRLSGDVVSTRQEALFLMTFLGSRALSAEPLVLKQLRRTEHQGSWDDQNKYLQRDLLRVLGAMETRNPESHRMLFHFLLSIEPYLSDAAIAALARIGEPAVELLKRELPKQTAAYQQMRILKVFQLRGTEAKAHLPWLKGILAANASPHVRDAAEDAIAAVSKS